MELSEVEGFKEEYDRADHMSIVLIMQAYYVSYSLKFAFLFYMSLTILIYSFHKYLPCKCYVSMLT